MGDQAHAEPGKAPDIGHSPLMGSLLEFAMPNKPLAAAVVLLVSVAFLPGMVRANSGSVAISVTQPGPEAALPKNRDIGSVRKVDIQTLPRTDNLPHSHPQIGFAETAPFTGDGPCRNVGL